MKILALEREVPGTPRTAFETLLRAEALRVWELHQAGIVRELYFRSDCPCAVLVLECDDLAAAEQTLASLPLVATGLIRFDLVPLRPYTGFERLFASHG